MTAVCSDTLRRSGVSDLTGIAIAVGATMALSLGYFATVGDSLDSMGVSNRITIESLTVYTHGDRLIVTGNVQNEGNQPFDSILIGEITAGDLVITQNNAFGDGAITDGHGDMVLGGLDNYGNRIRMQVLDMGSVVSSSASANNGSVAYTIASSLSAGSADKFYFKTITTHPWRTLIGTPAGGSPHMEDNKGAATVELTGLSSDETRLSALLPSESKSFRIEVTGVSRGGATGVLDVRETVPDFTRLYLTIAGTDGSITTISDPRSARVIGR